MQLISPKPGPEIIHQTTKLVPIAEEQRIGEMQLAIKAQTVMEEVVMVDVVTPQHDVGD